MRPVLTRLSAVAILIAALAAAWWPFWLGFLLIAIGAQRPDPSVEDGDPCCGHPDTWQQSAEYVGAGTLWAIVAAGLLAVAAAAAAGVVSGRPPRWIRGRWARRLAVVWALAAVAAGLLLAGG